MSKKAKTDTELQRKTISIPPAILKAGKALAKAEQRSFSSYVSVLISREAKAARATA